MTIGVPIVTGLPRLYQQCTNRQKQSKDSQNSKNDHWCTNRHISTKIVPTVYQQCTNRQKQSKDSQNSKNHRCCTNRHRSTKTVPTVQQCTNSVQIVKNSQKTVKTAKMTIGVSIVTCLRRVRRIHKVSVRVRVRVRRIHKAHPCAE